MGREDLQRVELSRRKLMGLGLGMGTAFGLAACNVQVSDGGKAGSNGSGLTFPDTGASVPADQVSLRWVDSGASKAPFNQAVAKAYTARHPNVAVSYTGQGWPVVNQTVTLGVRNGSAPDIFQLPQSATASTAIAEGWVRPLEDLIPDFAAWQGAWPEGTFIPGVHSFDGKIYTAPLNSNRRLSQMVIYDTKSFEDAGLDPSRDLASWDDMRAAARKITQQGGGKVYGLILPGGQRIGRIVEQLAVSAGWRSSETLDGLDYKTGEYILNAPEMLAGLDQLTAFVTDKSIFPGFITMKNQDVTGRMPNRVAGMTFDGPWNLESWAQTDPGWKFGVAAQPPQDRGGKIYEPFENIGANNLWVYSKSKYPQVAGDIIGYLGSVAGQTEMIKAVRGTLGSVFPEATKAAKDADLNEKGVLADRLAAESMFAAPLVAVRNPDAGKVLLELKSVKPNVNDVVQGILSGKITDARKALTELNDGLNKALDDAIASAKSKGAEVSRADFAFSNWDKTKDYGAEQYKEI